MTEPDAELLAVADELYAVSPAAFTAARDAKAKELKGTDLAPRVKALRKPSTAAWVVNLLVRRETEQVDQLLNVGAALREAQAAMSAGELRTLTKQRRQVTAAVTQQARSLAAEAGHKVTQTVADQVEATLTAAMVDEGAAAALRTGLLVSAMSSTGLEPLDPTEHVALPDLLDFTPSPIEAPAPKRFELRVVPDPDAQAKRRAAAEAELRSAQAAVDEADDDVEAAAQAVEELEARSLQLQSEIEELRRQLLELEERQEQTDDELGAALEELRTARTELSAATSARDRAQHALDRLDH